MKATFSTTGKEKGFNINHRKEKGFYKEYLVICPQTDERKRELYGNLKQVISCRMYATGATNYCALWVYGENYKSGTGKAGGYGYHRESAAAQDAINATGYELEKSISGVGEIAIESALKAICELEGFKDVQIFTSHA